MMIFNWMHRKFHRKDGKKGEPLAGNYYERETQVLLEQVTLHNLLDGWRDGILTIGTFGFDPVLTHFNQKLECPPVFDIEKLVEEEYAFDNIDSEDHEEEEEEEEKEFDAKEYYDDEEELNPLVFGCSSDNQDSSGSIYDDDDNINVLNLKASHDHPTTRPVYQFGFKYSKFSSVENAKQCYEKRERTTLADLFSADSSNAASANTKLQHRHVAEKKKKKLQPNHPKKGPSFAKKLESPRPVKKLQQLMRRMMKRKIHPDLEGLIQKGDAQIKPTAAEEEYGGIECFRFPSSN